MPFTPTNFQDGNPATPVSAANLNKLGGQYAAVAADAGNPATPFGAALSATIATEVETATPAIVSEAAASVPVRASVGNLYIPSADALRKWRARRALVQSGARQGRINIIGDSISFGAGTTGNTPPKYNSSWPGRLRARLNREFGDAGTGIVWANPDLLTQPTWDDRWDFGNATAGIFGPFRDGSVVVASGGDPIEFTAVCESFVVHSLPGGSSWIRAYVDGVEQGTIRNVSSGTSGVTLPPLYSGSRVITPVDAGALGEHTLRLEYIAGTFYLLGVEALQGGGGTWAVTTTAISGKSLSAGGFVTTNNDETNGFYGRPVMIDQPAGDITVVFLGFNDLQSGITAANIKLGLTNAVQRARASGTGPGSVPYANGDALLVIAPQTSNYGSLPFETDYRQMAYEVADEQNVALLDLSERWGAYATSNGFGMFAAGESPNVHPSDVGSQDIADAVHHALFTL